MPPESMKAAIFRGERTIEVEEVPVPVPEPGYVLLEAHNCGICGSDLHSYFGRWGQPETASGHEVVGTVIECGEGVTDITVGTRACVEYASHCGQCRFCRTGRYNHCERRRAASGGTHAGFAERVVAHASALYPVPEHMSPDDAMMIEPLAVSHRAFHRSRATYQDTLLVIGSGTIGLLAVATAKAAGIGQVIACARHNCQAELAEKLGADCVIRVPDQDVNAEVRQLTKGLGASAVIETTASQAGVNDALRTAANGGTIVLVGGFHKPLEVNLGRIVGGEIYVTGSNCYGYSGTRTDFDWSAELISSGRVQAGKLITHRFPLADIGAAFETAADKTTGSVKVQVALR
ncbi:MAG: alcohol dehydrogenase catalytic domain-containing protein [Lentisphaerae bacterium]|jgi:(R,R)-butanediol dehydrogenase / meso-butanediol dehydrogenase / diacetyl reductase|nr:alcohol dehydrogenase catalytic domain-containing protein [Lentisphaerota bacterium]MBT4820471.1 alcohol dehydrogenase catalytic domain-containing protein [Lentisphaerota bacterium]MBT5606327.1 alcohol dehydrogenase catalytic domain-containing protein [Lentisphaerota bacterium]MBT7059607.1 alcohol dehydrogenase catalytic domain-containing protein [Lentisphaerota bacterium]MBT7846279.1 alcohol dehydrogenase catalytic domain-containing protein [Lentisphaerota bacterium]